jgi:hypothetical protein
MSECDRRVRRVGRVCVCSSGAYSASSMSVPPGVSKCVRRVWRARRVKRVKAGDCLARPSAIKSHVCSRRIHIALVDRRVLGRDAGPARTRARGSRRGWVVESACKGSIRTSFHHSVRSACERARNVYALDELRLRLESRRAVKPCRRLHDAEQAALGTVEADGLLDGASASRVHHHYTSSWCGGSGGEGGWRKRVRSSSCCGRCVPGSGNRRKGAAGKVLAR